MYLCLECGSDKVMEEITRYITYQVSEDNGKVEEIDRSSGNVTDAPVVCAACQSQETAWVDDAFIPDARKVREIKTKEGVKRLIYWYLAIREERGEKKIEEHPDIGLLREKIMDLIEGEETELSEQEESELTAELI